MPENYSLTEGEQKDIVQYILTLQKQVKAGEMLYEVLNKSNPFVIEEWFCAWCDEGYDKHDPDCPRQLALAAWDAARNQTGMVKDE
jgi:hypothetical protein